MAFNPIYIIHSCNEFTGVHIWAGIGILFAPNFKSLHSIRFFRRKKSCSVIMILWLHDIYPDPNFCLLFLVLVTLLVFMTEGRSLGDSLIWAVSCPLFMGDFEPAANFSTPRWSDTEGRAPCLSMRRAMLHGLFRVDRRIMLMAVSFICHQQQYF